MTFPNISHSQASAVLAAIPWAGSMIYQRADSASSITSQAGSIGVTSGPSVVTVTIAQGGQAGAATFTYTAGTFTSPPILTAAQVNAGPFVFTFSGTLPTGESALLTPPSGAPRFKIVGVGGKTFFLNDSGQPAGGGYPAPPVAALPSGLNANGSQPTENVFAMLLSAQQYAQTPLVPTNDADYRLVNNGSGWLVPLS